MAKRLVELGITSISANIDAVEAVREMVARTEMQLMLRASRERLNGAYRRLYRANSPERVRAGLEDEEAAHERAALEYMRSGEHEEIRSTIMDRLDSSTELMLLDVNDNQDFPNVRDLTQRHIEDDYVKLALAVSAMGAAKA